MIIACLLIKMSLKNVQKQFSQWSTQRILRFSTSLILLHCIIFYTIYSFSYILHPSFTAYAEPKSECGFHHIAGTIGGVGYVITLPVTIVLAICTTVDRYKCLVLVGSTDLGGITEVAGVPSFLYPCLQIPGIVYVIYCGAIGVLSLTFAISDCV
jgi:hypothetical protein